LVPFAAVRLAAGLLFAAPAVPLLVVGEAYSEPAPFQCFTSFIDRELAERVRRGRLEEFSRFGWQGTIADPNAPATFVASRLNHALGGAPRHRALREYYRRWLTLRRTHAALGARDKDLTRVALEDAVLTLTRATPDRDVLPARRRARRGARAHPRAAGADRDGLRRAPRHARDGRTAGRRGAWARAPEPRRPGPLRDGPRERAHRGRRARRPRGASG